MITIQQSSWVSENSVRRYPLAEDATGISTDNVKLTDDFIVDMSIRIDMFPQGNIPWVSGIIIGSDLVTMTISVDSSVVLLGTYTKSTAVPFEPVQLIPSPGGGSSVGFVVFGNGLNTMDTGCYRFTPESGRLNHRSYAFNSVDTVSSIIVPGGDTVRGHVGVMGEGGIDVSIDNDIVYISLKKQVPGEGTSEGSPRAIQTINGVGPNNNGEIEIRFV